MVAMANATVAATIPANTTADSFIFWTSDGNSTTDATTTTDGTTTTYDSSSSSTISDYVVNATSEFNVTGYDASAWQEDFLDYPDWNQTVSGWNQTTSGWNQTVSGLSQLLNGTLGAYAANESATATVYGVYDDSNDTTFDLATLAAANGNGSVGPQYDSWPNSSMYPSGHTMTHIVITAVLVTLLMIMVVVGNMLVIVAIVTEKALKTIQNWFIASLAVADFLLGLVVMPFSLAQELMGYWIFGFWWCEIHLAVDVLLCTSSIMNLCLISLDRFWSITQAVDYLKKRTPGRAAFMITAVWTLSFLISVPPLLGWKQYSSQEANVPFCAVSDDMGYVIYSASGSFYIPSIIMVFVYVRIYFAARSRARRTVKKHRPTLDPTKDKSTTTTSFSNASPPDKTKGTPGQTPGTPREPPGGGGGGEGLNKVPQYLSPPAPISTIASAGGHHHTPKTDRTNGETAHERAANNNSEVLEPLLSGADKHHQGGVRVLPITGTTGSSQRAPQQGQGGPPAGHGLFFGMGSIKLNGNSAARTSATTPPGGKASPSPNRLVSQAHALAQAQAQILLSDEMECLSELDHSSDSDQPAPDSGVSGLRRLARLCNPPKKPNKQVVVKAAAADEIDLGRVVKPRDPEREKRRLARKKERRATLILGLIMASFILCWLPFFTLYVFRGFCKECYINEVGFSLAFWLGYCNSALNPVIYTIFNKDFRKAFRKILFK